MDEIYFPSSADGSLQPALYRKAPGKAPRPLVVALHTWSFDHTCGCELYEETCGLLGFDLIYPAFRGANNTPSGCGSTLMLSDLADAREYAVRNSNIDPARVYLIGGSGGGHASLLAAGRLSGLWTAVSSWCPISNIAAWHDQCRENPRFRVYSGHMESACGGDPSSNVHARLEAVNRSPLTWLAGAKNHILDINTGIHDGHTGSVPVSHALNAYNLLAAPEDRISETDIAFMTSLEIVPKHLRWNGTDPAYGNYEVLLRKISGTVRITLFEGGHDLLGAAGLAFLAKCRGGEPVDWSPRTPVAALGKTALSK